MRTVLFFIGLALFWVACVLDYLSSLGKRERNPFVRDKATGRISTWKFFTYVAVVTTGCTLFFYYDYTEIIIVYLFAGAAFHYWASRHNRALEKK